MDGLIYYNVGTKCLVRLAVSLSTLTRHYDGNTCILADNTSYDECEKIARFFGVDCIKTDFDDDRNKNWVLLNKCRLHKKTPFDRTIFLDADTIVLRDISPVFGYLDNSEFVATQMSNWLSKSRAYRKRIKGWKGLLPDRMYAHAFGEPKAVNIGFYGWNTGAKIFSDWYRVAALGRQSFIPDEIACQILLPHFDHLVINNKYNTSCKHDILDSESYTLHFHGRKHCRIENGMYLYHSDLWYNEFDKIRDLPFVRDNIQYDRMLVKNLGEHDGGIV